MIDVQNRLYLLPLLTVPLVLTGLAVKYVASVIAVKRKYKSIAGEDRGGLIGFLLGDVRDIMRAEKNGTIFAQFALNQMIESKSRIIKIRVLNKVFIVTSDPRIIKEVVIEQNSLKNAENYQAIFGFPAGMRFTGNGILTEINHEAWRHKRALLNPGFHKKALMQFMKVFNDKGDVLTKNLRSVAESQSNESIRLLDRINRAALDVIASVAFSMDVDSINDPNNQFHKYIYEALDGVKYFFFDPYIKYNPFQWRFLARYKQVLNYLRDIGRKQIESRLEAMKNGETLPDDILTTILQSNEDAEISIEGMVDEFVTFFIGGQETTANALASAFLELGRHPEVLKKLRDEIDTVLGSKNEIEYEDLHKLRYTGCVLKEALRMYPPATVITRSIREDIHIDDLLISKGSLLMISPFCSGRDEEFFPDALEFNPDRFLKDDSSIQNYTYFPFSIGPRTCIGQNFAQIEAKVLIAKLIQNFDFELDPNQTFDIQEVTTLRPKDGCKCFLKMRN